jgi:serine/threonine-protein kinase
MFLDEARLSGHLAHSNVVSVFDIGVGDGTYFIVMEYVDGADLKTVIEHQKKVGSTVPVEAAVFITQKICQGLAYAHELAVDGKPLNIIHRDITPANILITRYGEVKIVDFGLAKASSQLAESDAGVIKGKFGYLAPETVLELGADQRVDVFSVGIMLWEMLAGRRLFLGDTDFATVRAVRDANIPSLAQINDAVPPELEQIIRKALARDRDQRYLTARDLISATTSPASSSATATRSTRTTWPTWCGARSAHRPTPSTGCARSPSSSTSRCSSSARSRTTTARPRARPRTTTSR